MGAKIDFANLSQDKRTLGCTCFNDGVLMVWNDDRTKEYPLDVEKGYWTDLIPNTMGILIGYMLIIGIEILSPCPERNRQESVAEVAAPEE